MVTDVKLNLCCGHDIREGYFNYDKYPVNDRVFYLDCEVLPMSFLSDYADKILINQGLEHLNINPLDFMNDVNRILKKGGIVEVGLPVYSPFIYHIRFNHPIGYFDPICENRGYLVEKDVYCDGSFRMLDISFKRRKISNVYFNLKSSFRRIFFHSVHFKMEKV